VQEVLPTGLLFYFLLGLTGLFVFCAVIQIFYHWYFFLRVLQFRDLEKDPPAWPPVSVVICARNEIDNLKKLIPLLLEQDYPDFEIIIIDDRSDDPMYDYMLEQKAAHKKVKLVRINYTPEGMNPKKFALTMGIRSAQNQNLLFTDADCFPASDQWIKTMARHMTGQEEITLAYSPYMKESGLLNLIIRYDTFFTAVQYFSFALAGLPYMGVGRNLSYKKPLFMKLKGFYKHMPLNGGDDDLFVNRAASKDNISICLSPEAYNYSVPKKSWNTWYRQKTRHLAVGKFYKTRHKWLLGLYGATNLLFYLSVMPLFFFSLTWPLALGFFLFKTLNQALVMNRVKRIIAEPISFWVFPVLDFIHCILIFAFAIPARFSRRVTWM
jgi:cellulose synthase/poly-beta-1,6-N-acetylglucosamine synthase-like glycosyltransferase